MSAIVEFFVGIGDAIVALFNFVVDFLADLIWFIGFIVQMIPAMPSFFTWLPAGLAGMLGLAIGVVVILRILGRGD